VSFCAHIRLLRTIAKQALDNSTIFIFALRLRFKQIDRFPCIMYCCATPALSIVNLRAAAQQQYVHPQHATPAAQLHVAAAAAAVACCLLFHCASYVHTYIHTHIHTHACIHTHSCLQAVTPPYMRCRHAARDSGGQCPLRAGVQRVPARERAATAGQHVRQGAACAVVGGGGAAAGHGAAAAQRRPCCAAGAGLRRGEGGGAIGGACCE